MYYIRVPFGYVNFKFERVIVPFKKVLKLFTIQIKDLEDNSAAKTNSPQPEP